MNENRRCRETAEPKPPMAFPYKTSQIIACLDLTPERIPGALAWLVINRGAEGWDALPSFYRPDDKVLHERVFKERHAKLNELLRGGGKVVGLMVMEPVRASPEEEVTRGTPFKFYGMAMWDDMADDPEVRRFLDKCCEQFASIVARGEIGKYSVSKEAH